MATPYADTYIPVTPIGSVSLVDTEGLGMIKQQAGNLYRWVSTDVDVVANRICMVATYDSPFLVTDVMANTAAAISIMGMANHAALGDANGTTYFWLQISGLCAGGGQSAGAPAAGEYVVPELNGNLIAMSAGEEHQVVGCCHTAAAATSGNPMTVKLQGLV